MIGVDSFGSYSPLCAFIHPKFAVAETLDYDMPRESCQG